MRILIVDDHEVVRAGVMQILSDEFGKATFGEAADSAEAVGAMLKGKWDLAIVDISMPGRSGLDLLKQMKGLRPQMPVLILSMYPEEQYAVRALRAGAAGYLTKASLSEELVNAVRKIQAGGKYINAGLAERLAAELSAPSVKPPHESLSDRELEVLRLIAAGKTTKGIARELSLCVNTVSTYRARVLKKMNMQTNAELIRYAIENKLLD
jgi:DNA-binding NarL/FixJ family response regulator